MRLVLLSAASALALPALAQNPAPQQQVTVTVVNALPQPPQPVKAVRVSVMSQQVDAGQGVTNSKGQVQLVVSSGVVQAGGLHLTVTGADNLVIYQPAGGELSGITASIPVTLLPKGSLLLIDGPGQIEAMLHQMSLEISSLQKQNNALQTKANASQQPKPDLGAAITDWALANGFSEQQVDQQVQQWADSIQKQSNTATPEQKALAELALKHYATAAQLFTTASDADKQQFDADDAKDQDIEKQAEALQAAHQVLLDKARSSLRQFLDHTQQAAGADQLNLKYHDATQTLASAEATAQAEFKKHPDDTGFHELWLQSRQAAAIARESEGEVSPASLSLPSLAQAADDDQQLVREYNALGDRAETAAAQASLGIALLQQGQRTGDDQAMTLLDRAIQAFRDALQVYTKADWPQDWATTQMDLGFALMVEGKRATGENAMALYDEAIQANRSALEVFTKADRAQDWARIQMNLGTDLVGEGESAAGDKAMALLDSAVKAFRSALEVETKAGLPQDWARTQVGLGFALAQEGKGAMGDKAMPLLDQAVEAYHNALQVYNKAALPQDWAWTQMDLGLALEDEAERATGDKAMDLLDQTAAAYRSALEVYTEADLPWYWAAAQMILGEVLVNEGERDTGDKAKATALLDQAVQSEKNSLEVFTRDAFPQKWAIATRILAGAHKDLGDTASADAELKAANEVDPQ